jgi:hypothetical protein
LWAGFASGQTVPDPFRRLFDAIETQYSPLDARDAMLGYGILRRISVMHANAFDRDAINAFLVTLAAFDRSIGLTAEGPDSIWEALLAREPNRPFSNWAELRGFQNPETYPRNDFGLTFMPPPNSSQPWEIRTRWRRDDFMRVLLAIRPTSQELRLLLNYADIFIRTRPANQPLPGITLPNEPQGRMYTAAFHLGPPTPDAFIVDTPSATAEPSGEMEVDNDPSATPPKNTEPPA